MDWKVIKEIRLLLTSLPERLVWGILVSVVIIALALITKLTPPVQAAVSSQVNQVSGHISRG